MGIGPAGRPRVLKRPPLRPAFPRHDAPLPRTCIPDRVAARGGRRTLLRRRYSTGTATRRSRGVCYAKLPAQCDGNLTRRTRGYSHPRWPRNAFRHQRARSECLDWLLIRSERHLVRVLPDIEHYNHAWPHLSRDLRLPCASAVVLHRLRRISASVTGTGSAG
jgi:hypothetical protein